ncbi:MAG: Uma2 family endonuclease [Caldilineaceae bacterium]|nr:Uma2 family endonuclease [Caldilineaceae bacterium]
MIGEEPRLKLTYADYLATPEDKRYELLDGELLMLPAPDELHQRTQAELGYNVMAFVKTRG